MTRRPWSTATAASAKPTRRTRPRVLHAHPLSTWTAHTACSCAERGGRRGHSEKLRAHHSLHHGAPICLLLLPPIHHANQVRARGTPRIVWLNPHNSFLNIGTNIDCLPLEWNADNGLVASASDDQVPLAHHFWHPVVCCIYLWVCPRVDDSSFRGRHAHALRARCLQPSAKVIYYSRLLQCPLLKSLLKLFVLMSL